MLEDQAVYLRILGAHDDALRTKLDDHRAALDATVREKDAKLQG